MTPPRNGFPHGGLLPGVEPRWLADEMLGRLARYLRFMGFDTEYARGRTDEDVRRWAEREERILLTRDRELAHRVRGAMALEATDIDGQLTELRRAFPSMRWEVRCERCTLCNGILDRWSPPPGGPLPAALSPDVVERGSQVYRCPSCGHFYWEGSHGRSLRGRLARVGTPSEG